MTKKIKNFLLFFSDKFINILHLLHVHIFHDIETTSNVCAMLLLRNEVKKMKIILFYTKKGKVKEQKKVYIYEIEYKENKKKNLEKLKKKCKKYIEI